MSEDTELHGREGMLNSTFAHSHYSWRNPFMHSVQRVLIQMAGQTTFRSLCATRLQRAGAAVANCSFIDRISVLTVYFLATQLLVSRTNVGMGIRFIEKFLTAEQTTISLVI